MHVLGSIGHSFSQRRSSPKPRDLHIRKVSSSGFSLASGCSTSSSSTSSTSTTRAPSSVRTTVSNGFDPLHSHPTFQPPPRLYDRPLISPGSNRLPVHSTFYDDSLTDEEYLDEKQSMDDDYIVCSAQALHFSQPKEMVLPPHSSPSDHHDNECSEPQDYFTIRFVPRPAPAPRSRWSDSTIQTLDQMTPGELSTLECDTTPETEEDVPLDIPNFSHKRTATPQRPPLRSLDSLEDFIKKGGWKRRGIVFNSSDAGQ